tara:strand:+ start:1402 stop:1662 length:261 start_codon:yes stop_codon:yes gene_type:complete
MNKQGRKYDREKWGWKTEEEANKHLEELNLGVEMFDVEMMNNQGRSTSNRENTNKILVWTFISGISLFLMWGTFMVVSKIIVQWMN